MATDEHPRSDEQTRPPEPPESERGGAGAATESAAPEVSGASQAIHATDATEAKLAELEAELAREREASADYLRRWQQAQADLANYKRRAQHEQEQHARLATGRALALMLPAIDSFERAFATLPSSLRGYSWISGLALVEMQLQSALAASGAAEVPAEPGAVFNPQHHEAVGEVETTEHPVGHIAAVLQRGYAIQGLLIRPALVQLARAPEESGMQASPGDVGAASPSGEPPAASPAPSDGGGGAAQS